MKSTDGAQTFKVENTSSSETKGFIFLGAAAASDDHAVVTGLLEDYYTTDGFNFHNSIGPGLINEQIVCAKVIPGKSALGTFQFGVAGHFNEVNGVGVSTTDGLDYKGFGPSAEQLNPKLYPARYADFPSTEVFYATFGSYPAPTPAPPADSPTDTERYHLTDKITIERRGTGAVAVMARGRSGRRNQRAVVTGPGL